MERHYSVCPLYQCEPSLRQQGALGFTSATHHNYLCTALIQHVRCQSQPHTEAPIKSGILQIKKYWFDWGFKWRGVPTLTMSNSASFLKTEYASSYPLERR